MKPIVSRSKNGGTGVAASCRADANACRSRISGNIFFVLFAAVAMVGVIGYGFSSILRGPITTMTEVTRRTVAENTMISSSRVAIVSAVTQQTNGGDCDGDGAIEPLPFRDAGSAAHPAGGGYIPTGLITDTLDSWKTEYGYCVWDSGSISVSDNNAGCGGSSAKRLEGSPSSNQYTIAIISAGRNKKFQTACNAYVDANNDQKPDTDMLAKAAGSDDLVLSYTYAEANDLGNGLWKIKAASPDTAQTNKNLAVSGDATFGDKVVLTTGGLVLPGDPGDDSLTGPCNSANDKQLRRNTSSIPPKIEICDYTSGLGWTLVSGASAEGNVTGSIVGHWRLDEGSGTTAIDSVNGLNGTLEGSPLPTWNTTSGAQSGALSFTGVSGQDVRITRAAEIEPSAITIAFWMKRQTTQSSYGGLIFKSGSNVSPNYYPYAIYFNNMPSQLAFATGAGGAPSVLATNTYIPANQWVHVTAVYDPAGNAPQKRIYVNGLLNNSVNATGAMIYQKLSGHDLYLGTNKSSNASFNGDLDDVRIYNFGMTSAQVADLYSQSAPAFQGQVIRSSGDFYTWGWPSYMFYSYPAPVLNGKDFIYTAGVYGTFCGVKTAGTVWCWGDNKNGVFGNNSPVNATSTTLVQATGLTGVVKIGLGRFHACAVKSDGTVWCWGDGTYGAMGNGTNTVVNPLPVQVPGLSNFIDVTSGKYFSCGVKNDGTAWCWGKGTEGQLGNGATLDSNIPVQVSNITDFVSLSAANATLSGDNNICGVTKSGKGYCWGTETNGNFGDNSSDGVKAVPSLIPDITDFVEISTEDHTCGLRAMGDIWCAGPNAQGQLGTGTTTNSSLFVQSPYYSDFTSVSAGYRFTCGIRKNREAYCWGDDSSMQLGNTSDITNNQTIPSKVAGSNFVQIFAGDSAAVGIVDPSPQGMTVNTEQRNLIATSADASCIIRPDKTLWCWGQGGSGALANGSTALNKDAPVPSVDNGPWLQIFSPGHTKTFYGIKADGSLWYWGQTGSSTSNPTPVMVPDDDPWVKAGAGNAYACALKMEGTIWCWGSSSNGVLGNPSSSSTTTPQKIDSTDRWKDVAVGYSHSCGVKEDGSAWCWGSDSAGQLGNGETLTGNQTRPSMVTDPGPWSALTAGRNFTCGIKADGSAWCWGAAVNGVLGNDQTVTNAVRPAQVAGSGPWTILSAGNEHVCGVKLDGTAWCWGRSEYGRLGDNITGSNIYAIPAPVQGGGDYITITAGYEQTCGIKSDLSTWCWGRDLQGMLGNSSTQTISLGTPSRVFFPHELAAFIATDSLLGYAPPLNVNMAVGTSSWIYGVTQNTGLNLAASGLTRLLQASTSNQLLVESSGVGNSAQLSFKAAGAKLVSNPVGNGISRWLLDEGSGTTAVDSTSSYNGTVVGGATWQSTGGKLGGALLLNGTSQYVSVVRRSQLETQAFTYSFWVKPTSIVADDTLISKSYAGNTGIGTSYMVKVKNANGQLSFVTGHSDDTVDILGSNAVLKQDTWTQVTISYNPALESRQKKIYINGVLDNEKTLAKQIKYDATATGNLFFGQAGCTSACNLFHGSMDDIRFFDTALGQADVASLYYYSAQDPVTYSTGSDFSSGSLLFARNNAAADNWLSERKADIAIGGNGNVGIGGVREPSVKLDVRGGIKISNDTGSCSSAKAGVVKYAGGSAPWKYCNGSSWQDWISIARGTWDTSRTSLSSGGNISHSCSLKINGPALCWGNSGDGKLGNNTATGSIYSPSAVLDDSGAASWSDWKYIATGSRHSCGIRVNGTLWCWGLNSNGQLGDNTVTSRALPVQVLNDTGGTGWSDWKKVTAGELHTCGIRTNGTAWCWGYQLQGRLGNNVNSAANQLYPTKVWDNSTSAGWSDWINISSSNDSNCGTRADGTAWCWGNGNKGKLGAPNAILFLLTGIAIPLPESLVPSKVWAENIFGGSGWTDWKQISVSNTNGCGVRADGSAWCWGASSNGALGSNSLTFGVTGFYSSFPERIRDNTASTWWNDWSAVYASDYGGCGIRSNGTAWCWGSGGYGRLGNNSTSDQFVPVQVHSDSSSTGWSDWTSLQPGNRHFCGTRSNGTLWCWGVGSDGVMGNGIADSNHLRPTEVQ